MSSLDLVVLVARQLGTLRDRVVFVGGAVRGLLVTDPGAAPERATDDVDVIVELASAVEFHRLGDQLRALGFRASGSASSTRRTSVPRSSTRTLTGARETFTTTIWRT